MSENKVNVVLQEGESKEKGVFTVVNNPHRQYSEAVADYYYTGGSQVPLMKRQSNSICLGKILPFICFTIGLLGLAFAIFVLIDVKNEDVKLFGPNSDAFVAFSKTEVIGTSALESFPASKSEAECREACRENPRCSIWVWLEKEEICRLERLKVKGKVRIVKRVGVISGVVRDNSNILKQLMHNND